MLGGLARTAAWVIIVALAGCSAKQQDHVTSPAEAAAIQLIREEDDGSVVVTPDGAFLERNPTYKTFAARVLSTNPTGGQFSVEAARLSSKALDQTLYPQFRPTVSVDENGDPLGRVGITQIIFSNGQFQAEKGVLRAGEIEAVAEYLISANQRVADGMSDYLEIDYYRQLARTAEQLEAKYAVWVDQAERRVAGGVGDETEIATFKLKLLEAQADAQVNRANQQLAASRVRGDLTAGLALPSTPPKLQSIAPSYEAPEVVLLLAQMAAAESQIDLERSRRRPSLSIDAFTERNLATGGSDDGISLWHGSVCAFGRKE